MIAILLLIVIAALIFVLWLNYGVVKYYKILNEQNTESMSFYRKMYYESQVNTFELLREYYGFVHFDEEMFIKVCDNLELYQNKLADIKEK